MKSTAALKTFLASSAGKATSFSMIALASVAAAALYYGYHPRMLSASGASIATSRFEAVNPSTPVEDSGFEPGDEQLTVSREKAGSLGLRVEPTRRSGWTQRLRATGRIELNSSRVAEVSPLVQGVVREALVEVGQTVRRGEVLAYVDSREVGEAKLHLTKDRLQLTSALRRSEWCEQIHKNVVALLDSLGQGESVDQIRRAFQDRPVGAYRQQLIAAAARLTRTQADYERLQGLGANGVIPEKETIRARAEYEIAEATYVALREQIRFDSHQQSLDAKQALQEAEAAVAISRSQLLILGYGAQNIDAMDAIAEAQRVAYYPIRSPLDGTIIAKDVPLSKHVDEHSELFQIADLSTVWLRADVHEKHIQAALGMQGKSVTFQTGSYPGRQFTAEVFSIGDMVDDQTRAARLLATCENAQRLLKPGMFVEVTLTPQHEAGVLQLPTSAVQRHDGATFVFVSSDADQFDRRDVTLGRATSDAVEVVAGLAEGELVAVEGGFALKSAMLSELLTED